MDGKRSLSENIADIGGAKMAYRAYTKWASQNEIEPQIDHLLYTPQQLFWISIASTQCAAIRREYLRNFYVMNGITPPEFRIIGSFSNIPEFSKDFNCPLGSPMNPEKKCNVW